VKVRQKLLLVGLAALVLRSVPMDAQQLKKMPRVGFVALSTAAAGGQNLEAFRAGLRDVGYVEDRNIRLEPRWADGWAERLPNLLQELILKPVDIIVISSAAGALAAKKATTAIPIVFAAVTDPFEHGLIANLAHPGGNLTGTSLAVGEGFSGKWVEFLRDAAPKASNFSVLWNPNHPVAAVFAREAELAAQSLSVRLRFFEARDPKQLDMALANIEKGRSGALLVLADPIFFTQRKLIADFAISQRLPSTFLFSEFAEAGGLMSYGPSITDSHRRAAIYVDKILKGAKPGALPVEQPTKFELVINLKTAKQIGLPIPPNVLARADKVIR
jgi:putative tryptophan/tyrosine transport system substrate-binding protein